MRIGFDAKRAFFNRSGLGNYSRTLLLSLAQLSLGAPEMHLYSPGRGEEGIFPESDSEKFNVHLPQGFVSRIFPSVWRSRGMVRDLLRDQIEVYHGLSAELPFGAKQNPIKSVVTVHDLIFLHHPEFYGRTQAGIYDRKCRHACKIADQIVAVSEETRRDLVKFYGIDPAKIQMIYQGIDPIFDRRWSGSELNSLQQKYQLPGEFALFVGNLEPRKNLENLIRAWQLSETEKGKLLICGAGQKYLPRLQNLVAELKMEPRISFAGRVPQEDLPGLYQAARLFIYPALQEGFGIPILEAISSGCPVITSEGGVFAEAGGDAAVYADPLDAKDLAGKISQVWNDPALRESMRSKGLQHARHFDRAILARQWMDLYNGLLK